jgi:hypothetical protein
MLADEKDDYERRKKQVAEALFADIKQQKLLEIQRRQLKESIYEVCQAKEDHSNGANNTFLVFSADDVLFVVKKDKLWYGEHAANGKRGFFPPEKVKEVDRKTRAYSKKSGGLYYYFKSYF